MKALFDYTVQSPSMYYTGEGKEVIFYMHPDGSVDLMDSAIDAARRKIAKDFMVGLSVVKISNVRIVE